LNTIVMRLRFLLSSFCPADKFHILSFALFQTYLHQKDKRALPVNFQNSDNPPPHFRNVLSFTTPATPPSLALSPSLLPSGFHMNVETEMRISASAFRSWKESVSERPKATLVWAEGWIPFHLVPRRCFASLG
jgi:hypothetical protein